MRSKLSVRGAVGFMRSLAVIIAMAAVSLSIWKLRYSDADPKGLRYVCWKAGICRTDLDSVMDTMVGDANRSSLVVGLTRENLVKRFGYLVEVKDASPYLRSCYEGSDWHGREVAFLRKSSWMVVFDRGRAVELVLIKGC